jgi:hypothetical protein
MTRFRLLSGALLVFGVVVLGCSPSGPRANARVSGSITYKGQPVKGGVMKFVTPEGTAYNALISPDGTYAANDIPPGELIITVDTEAINPGKSGPVMKGSEAAARAKESRSMQKRPGGPGGGGAEPPPNIYVKIPAKYANSKTSPLTLEVKPGRQVHNIELTD